MLTEVGVGAPVGGEQGPQDRLHDGAAQITLAAHHVLVATLAILLLYGCLQLRTELTSIFPESLASLEEYDAQRKAAVARYKKQMAAQRKAYFRRVRSAKLRKAFGKAIAGHQLIQKNFSDMATSIEAARSKMELLEDWPERVLTMQRNWIGRSEGAELQFRVDGSPGTAIPVFTTRPDTLFGATFFVMAPEHPDIERLAAGTGDEDAVREYVNRALTRDKEERGDAEREKTGVPLGRTVTLEFRKVF